MTGTIEGVKQPNEGRAKVIAVASVLALAAAGGMAMWVEFLQSGTEGGCPLCHGDGSIGGLIPCPIHGGGTTPV